MTCCGLTLILHDKRVEGLISCADRLEAQYQTARKQVDNLPPALLAKAFRGELVPQDPNDEPASALLERIRVERTNSEKKVLINEGAKQTRGIDESD